MKPRIRDDRRIGRSIFQQRPFLARALETS
jgi:hypothetical protein